ncbi:MAG: bpX6 domain-containing protein [Leucothrix sp.]
MSDRKIWDNAALQGFYEVQGYFFANDFLNSTQIQQRILNLWEDGSSLYEIAFGYILIQPIARFQNVEQAQGVPLIWQSPYFSNRRYDTVTTPALHKTSDKQLQLLHHGQWHLITLNNQNQYDPAQWFETGHYQLFKLTAHAQPVPKKPTQVTLGDKKNTREILSKENLKPSSELQALLTNLKQKTEYAKQTKLSSTANKQPTKVDLLTRMKASLSRMLMRSPLGDAIGKSQAKFIEEMLQQFQNGNIDDALKRAVPLGTMQDLFDNIDHPMIGQFMPRSDLSISLQRSRGGQSVSLDEQVVALLRQTYQRAFDTLDAAGRIEEAAFVLIDLLQDIDRALNYLEKHNKHRIAAQVAEGHVAKPARVIRQWVLAGDWQRAIQIARISGCYEEAITLLSHSHPQEAEQLRRALAQLHYQSGDLATAIEIIWPIADERHKALAWLKQSVALGGKQAIQHRLRLAIYDEENKDEHLNALHATFKNDHDLTAIDRLRLINELSQYPNKPVIRHLASMAVRPYLRDVAKGRLHHDQHRWNRLITLCDDQVLQVDMSRINIAHTRSKQPLLALNQPANYPLTACFGRRIYDCQRLADGSLLLAFAEAGLEHWSQHGKLLTSYADICHQIVASDHGYQALLVAVYEGFQVISIFDLTKRSTRYWQQTQLDTWANNYDGLSWIVAQGDSLMVLDLQQTDITALWALNDLKGNVINIQRSRTSFSLITANNTQFELWTYQLPELFLKERTPLIHETLNAFPAAISSSGKMVLVSPNTPTAFAFHTTEDVKWLDSKGAIQQLQLLQDYLLVSHEGLEEYSLSVYLASQSNEVKRLVDIHYPKNEQLQCHYHNKWLVLYSDTGRVMVIELTYGSVVSEFTTTAL